MEEFIDLPGYEGRYQVSDLGRVKSLINNIILKPFPNKQGYLMVRISSGNNNTRCRTVHLLVASCFLNHQSDGTQRTVVDHIDDDNTNNQLSNLQLISQRENAIKAGYKGYSLHKKSGLFLSRIYIDGKHKCLGYFKTPELARQAYQNELTKLNIKI